MKSKNAHIASLQINAVNLQFHARKFVLSYNHLRPCKKSYHHQFISNAFKSYAKIYHGQHPSLLRSPRKLQKTLSRFDIGACVSFRLVREGSISSPKVDQRLHWLQLRRLQHVNFGGGKDKVAEAAVHAFFKTEMVEGVDEVGPVEMSVDTEHLTEDGLADFDKLGREATTFPNPITWASELRERCVQSGRTCGNGAAGARSVETTRCVGCARGLGWSSVVSKGDAGWIGWEDIGVVDLARNPSLHKRDVFMSRNFNGLFARVQPGERMISRSYC
jgi:hypothetical protein